MRNGAELLITALADAGVEVCFANPGTSEMQLVAAIDKEPRIHAVLGLFEGVVTGAADGYGRMADKPALTLLHLGPGLGNGTANLHNAKRASSPVLNMIGDHATYHRQYDAPLTSDIEAFAKPVSDWIGSATCPEDLAAVGIEGYQQACRYPGQVASFIAPADCAWNDCDAPIPSATVVPAKGATDQAVNSAAERIQAASRPVLFLGGRALREDALYQAGRIAAATGARLVSETFSTRLQRGVGRVAVERLPYFGEQAAEHLAGTDVMVIVGSKAPVSFFAYPGKPSVLTPDLCHTENLADVHTDALDTLTRLADVLSAPTTIEVVTKAPEQPLESGPLNMIELGKVMGNRLPEQAIVSDEGATNGLGVFLFTANAAAHDWLMLTGGAIGQGLPVAVGAAMACPDRKIIALQADGSAMYTPQALWTLAREKLDVTVVLLNNRSYAILNIEMDRVGAQAGAKARSLLDLSNPDIDWVGLAISLGVSAERVTTTEAFDSAFAAAMQVRGPHLIEAILPGMPGLPA